MEIHFELKSLKYLVIGGCLFKGGFSVHCLECKSSKTFMLQDLSDEQYYNYCWDCKKLLKSSKFEYDRYNPKNFYKKGSYSCVFNPNSYENKSYKAYRSQYKENNDEKLIYSPRIYLEKVIQKYYENNTDIKNNYGKILKLNDELENAYKQVKDVKRKNSLNVHFKLYKLVQLCGVKCDIRDFKISIKLEKNLNEYQTIWEKICKINDWKLIDD
ncbi:UNVERIFIED_CONTAM: hypothetical protein RMT77_003989 [Armadillidium vulgare]